MNVVALAHFRAVRPEEKEKIKIEQRTHKAHNLSIYRHTTARILININSLRLLFQISRVRRCKIEYQYTSMEQAIFNPLS